MQVEGSYEIETLRLKGKHNRMVLKICINGITINVWLALRFIYIKEKKEQHVQQKLHKYN